MTHEELVKRAFKYYMILIAIILALKYTPSSVNISCSDIITITTIIMCVMVALDMYCPTLKIHKPIQNAEELYE